MLNSHTEAQQLRKTLEEPPPHSSVKESSPRASIAIQFIRIGSKLLDEDNLAFAFKGIRDAATGWFFPDLLPGLADGLPIWKFSYSQEIGPYGIRISITPEVLPC